MIKQLLNLYVSSVMFNEIGPVVLKTGVHYQFSGFTKNNFCFYFHLFDYIQNVFTPEVCELLYARMCGVSKSEVCLFYLSYCDSMSI